MEHQVVVVVPIRIALRYTHIGWVCDLVFCWPSSFVLSNYIASHPELVQNKCVLELGAGVGLPGLVVSNWMGIIVYL